MKIQASSIQRQISELQKKVSADKNVSNKLTTPESDKEELKLREASKKLEGQFLSQLIKSMENTIPKDDKKQSMATMMFSSVMGQQMSENGGIGLADFIYQSLKENGMESINKMSEMGAYNPFYAPTMMGDFDE